MFRTRRRDRLTPIRSDLTLRLPAAVAAGVSAVLMGLSGCGGGAEPRETSTPASPTTASPSGTAVAETSDGTVLSGDTSPGSVSVFVGRGLCVNASDYYYVLTNFGAAPTSTVEPDAAFIRAGIARAENLARALGRQLPPRQAARARGAVKTWQVVEREGRQRGYKTDDLPAFFDDLADQVGDYIPGNAALTEYLVDRCATKIPEFGTALAPPT